MTVKITNPIWRCVTVHTNPVQERGIVVSVCIITEEWQNYRPVFSRMISNGPMTDPFDDLLPRRSDYE